MNRKKPTRREDTPVTPDGLSPSAIASEQAVLAAMIIDQGCCETYCQKLTPGDFYRDEHAELFALMQDMIRQKRLTDYTTIFAEMEARGKTEACGGPQYLMALDDHLSHVRMAPEHASRVIDASQKRRQAAAANELLALAAAPDVPASDVQERAESLLGDIGAAQQSETASAAGDIIHALTDKIEDRAENPSAMLGIPSGLRGIDRMINGLQSPDLIVVGARPGMGKSSLLTTVCARTALDGHPTLIFSMEMSREQVMLRVLCSIARIDQHTLRSGQYTPEEFDRYANASRLLYNAPLTIDEKSSCTPAYMRAVARRFRQKHGHIGLIGIDYVQLMRSERKTDNRTQELTEVSIEVKGMAREFGCPVIALAQASRACESREDKRPLLIDLKDCGQFEQDADIVAFIFNAEHYRKKASGDFVPSDALTEVEFIIRKHRNGPQGTVPLGFVERYTRFSDWGG